MRKVLETRKEVEDHSLDFRSPEQHVSPSNEPPASNLVVIARLEECIGIQGSLGERLDRNKQGRLR